MTFYTDEQKAETLALLVANAGNYSETARNTGISDVQIRRWAIKMNQVPVQITTLELSALIERKKEALADLLEAWSHVCIKSFNSKLKQASLRDASGSMKLSIEAMQLLRQQPTTITARVLTDQEIADGLNSLAEKPSVNDKLRLVVD